MNQEMKKIEVVAAVIFKDGKVFATQRGHGEFKDGWEFRAARSSRGRHRKMRSAVRSGRNLKPMF